MKELFMGMARYNFWANGQFITLLRSLGDEVMEREILSSFPALRETVLHIWAAEDMWLQRLQRVNKPVWSAFGFKGSNAVLLGLWERSSAAFAPFIEKLDNDDFGRSIPVVNSKGERYQDPVDGVLQHVFNHSTYHRGQLVTMLRQCGVTGVSGYGPDRVCAGGALISLLPGFLADGDVTHYIHIKSG